jgi:hypothetical protein
LSRRVARLYIETMQTIIPLFVGAGRDSVFRYRMNMPAGRRSETQFPFGARSGVLAVTRSFG